MTRRLLTPSRLICHHEAAMQARMAELEARGDLDSARMVRKALAEVSVLRSLAAATEQSGSWCN